MIARISLSVLLAASVLWPSALSAQWASPGADPMGGYAPPPGPNPWEGGYAPPGGQNPWEGGYAPQPGLDYHGDGSGYGHSPGYNSQPLPWERDGDSPFRNFLTDVATNSYFRVEYLSWDVDDVGSGGIGGHHQFAIDQRNRIPFGIFDVDSFLTQDLLIPSAEPISFNKTSGLRATYGVPLMFGKFEISAFGLEDNRDGIRNAIPAQTTVGSFTTQAGTLIVVPPTIPIVTFPFGADPINLAPPNRVFVPQAAPGPPETFITFPGDLLLPGTIFNVLNTTAVAIPLTQNGAPGLTALLYDVAYAASYHSDLWGAESKVILDYGPTVDGLSLKPLVGFRYMSFDEQFRQVGITSFNSNIVRNEGRLYTVANPIFAPIGPTQVTQRGPLRASIIDSETENTLFGLQVGTRAEYDHKWFSLGVEPRISMGVNKYEAQVTTTNLRSAADGVFRTSEDSLTFAPVFDVSMYGKVHLSPYFSLHAGYNFTYLFQVTRPVDNVVYNDNGPGAPPGVVVDAETNDMHIQGLTIGGEFRFRDIKFR